MVDSGVGVANYWDTFGAGLMVVADIRFDFFLEVEWGLYGEGGLFFKSFFCINGQELALIGD